MYIQGQYATASRNLITGQNTSGPAGVPFYMPPGAPTLVSAVGGSGTITLSWVPPNMCSLPNQSAEIQNLTYVIYLTNISNVTTTVGLNATTITSSPYTVSVSAGTYSCRAAAQFPLGQVGSISGTISATAT
jgi:hypothetical protein